MSSITVIVTARSQVKQDAFIETLWGNCSSFRPGSKTITRDTSRGTFAITLTDDVKASADAVLILVDPLDTRDVTTLGEMYLHVVRGGSSAPVYLVSDTETHSFTQTVKRMREFVPIVEVVRADLEDPLWVIMRDHFRLGSEFFFLDNGDESDGYCSDSSQELPDTIVH